MEYKIVHMNNWPQLENEVNILISKGWKPQGGVTADNFYFYQAMIRDIPKK